MATYGPNAGQVPFTGFSPTLGVSDAIVPQTSGNVQFNGVSQEDDRISRQLWDRATRPMRRLLLSLMGVAPGSNATETYKRILGSQGITDPAALGGLVTIETVTQLNRNTTAADVTNLTAALSRTPVVAFPADVSGNSGGGKLGY